MAIYQLLFSIYRVNVTQFREHESSDSDGRGFLFTNSFSVVTEKMSQFRTINPLTVVDEGFAASLDPPFGSGGSQ